MGHPRRLKKKYARPKRPYDKKRIEEEKKLLREFGLKRKQEIWRAESMLRGFRRRARELLAKPDEKKQKEFFEKLNKIGLRCEKLEDVLDIKIYDILSRRLQTMVYKKRLANTLKQARQMITHRNIIVNERKIWWPSYLVPVNEENKIELNPKLKMKLSEAK